MTFLDLGMRWQPPAEWDCQAPEAAKYALSLSRHSSLGWWEMSDTHTLNRLWARVEAG